MKFSDMPKLPLVLVALMIAAGAALYQRLPARIPTHWGLTGGIDSWAAKSPTTVFLVPFVLLVLYAVMWLVPYLDPRKSNLVRAKKAYGLTVDLLALLLGTVFMGQLTAAFHPELPMTSLIEAVLGVMLVVIGRTIVGVGPNFTMGIRFRPTLADEVVWAKTNRLGGILFMAAGVLAAAGAFLPPVVGVVLLVAPTLVIVVVTYVYARRLYAERHPVGEPPRPPGAGA
jgi:uncharacterized membrane protein